MPDAASAADDHWHAPPARAVRLHAGFVAAMLPAWAGRGLRRSYNAPMTEFAAALLYALAWSVARLPWPLLRALADGVAALSIAVNAREARVARRNLELIRPDLDGAAREMLMRDILRTTARQAFETLRLWTRPASRNLAEIAEVHGEARFDAALLYALAWSVARLPWPLLRGLADGIAALSVAANAREARVARRNLELIRPELDARARDALMRSIVRTTARQAFETLHLWTRPASRNLADIVEIHGEALFDAALRDDRGLIVAAPHMGNWSC